MRSQAGPFTYAGHPSTLAQALGTSLERVAAVRDLIETGQGYERRTIWVHGKSRQLAVPREPVKALQRRISDFLWPLANELHEACYGYRPGRSAVLNAARHCGQRWVQRLDIKDFFPTTRRPDIERALQTWGASPVVAELLAALTTDRNHLPLGAPTSPMLGNLVLHPVDERLAVEADAVGVIYTRYADDLTFSATEEFDMTPRVAAVLKPLGYRLNPEKSRLRQRGQRIVVTGLTVAEPDRPRLPKQFKRRLRQELYYAETLGIEEHCLHRYYWPFIGENDHERQVEFSVRHLRGKLRYALGVEPSWTKALLAAHPTVGSELLPQTNTAERRRSGLADLAAEIRARAPVALSSEPRPVGIPPPDPADYGDGTASEL